jgi:hypothetical protein
VLIDERNASWLGDLSDRDLNWSSSMIALETIELSKIRL